MSELKIIATIVVKPEFKDDMLAVLKKVADGSRKEEGNVSYDLHLDVKDPLKFVLIEVWKSQEAIATHNKTSHYMEFTEASQGKVDNINVDIVKLIY